MISHWTFYKCNRRAFTLVEISVAVLVSAIIASIALVTVRSATTQIAADQHRGRSAWFLRLDSILASDLRQSTEIKVEEEALKLVTRAIHPAFDEEGCAKAVRVEYQIESRPDWGEVWVRSVRPEHQLTNDEPEVHELAFADQVLLLVQQGGHSIWIGSSVRSPSGSGLIPQSDELLTAEFVLVSQMNGTDRGVP